MPTRLDSFMVTNGIQPALLARATPVSRQHLLRLRQGAQDPTRGMMVEIARACGDILGRRVFIAELFDLRPDVTSSG